MSSVFGRLYKYLWYSKHLKKGTDISVCWPTLLATLLYGSEPWVTYQYHLWHLEWFSILNIQWSDYIANIKVLEKTKITSIEAMLMISLLGWAGHVSRMRNHHLPRIILCTNHNRRPLKKQFTAWKNPLVPVTSIIVDSPPLLRLLCLLSHHQPYWILLWKYSQVCSQKQKALEKPQYYAIKPLTRPSTTAATTMPTWLIAHKCACSQCGLAHSWFLFHKAKPWFLHTLVF